MASIVSRVITATAVLAIPAALLFTGAQPAAAATNTTQSGTCVDGGGVRWTGTTTWGASYLDSSNVRRTTVGKLSWTTTGKKVATEAKVQTFEATGTLAGTTSWAGTFDYKSGKSSQSQNPFNPATTGQPRITLTVGVAGDKFADCSVTFIQPKSTASVSDIYEADIIDASNRERTARKVTAVKSDSCLDRYAEAQATRMAKEKRMFHQDPSIALKACKMYTAGENVGYGFPSGATVTQAWMNSPSHRANLLTANYRLIGVGAVQADNGVWYTSQVFGARP